MHGSTKLKFKNLCLLPGISLVIVVQILPPNLVLKNSAFRPHNAFRLFGGSENKHRLSLYTLLTDRFYNADGISLLCGKN